MESGETSLRFRPPFSLTESEETPPMSLELSNCSSCAIVILSNCDIGESTHVKKTWHQSQVSLVFFRQCKQRDCFPPVTHMCSTLFALIPFVGFRDGPDWFCTLRAPLFLRVIAILLQIKLCNALRCTAYSIPLHVASLRKIPFSIILLH